MSLHLSDRLEAFVTLVATAAPQRLFLRQPGRTRDDAFGMTSMGDASGSGMDLASVAVHQPLQRVTEVAEKVPAIGDLDGIRCSLSGSLRIGSGPITSHDFHPGVLIKPSRNRVRPPIRQKIDDAPTFEIADDRAVAAATTERPVVDADDAGRRMTRQISRSDQAQQRVATGRQGEPRRQARSGLTADRKPEVALNIAEPYRPPRLDAHDGGQALGENPPGAVQGRAPKPSSADLEHDGMALPGEICQPAPVARMQVRRWLSARWAGGEGGPGVGVDYHRVRSGINAIRDKTGWNE